MGDDVEQEPAIVSDFPAPPSYYLSYGPNGTPLPPPPIPEDGSYTLFGVPRKLNEQTPTLEVQGLKTLYDVNSKPKDELKNLVVASRTKFVGLIRLLAQHADREEVNRQFEDMDMHFINMLYIVNEMRSAQAKTDLKKIMRNHNEAKRRTIAVLNETIEKASKDLEAAFASAAELSAADVAMNEDSVSQSQKTDDVTTAVDAAFRKRQVLDLSMDAS